MKKISLKLNAKKIPIYIGNNLLRDGVINDYIKHRDVVIITNTKVAKLHLGQVKKAIKNCRIQTLILPDGEKYKNVTTLNKVHDYLVKNKFNRDLTIIALGGGVIGDLAGFASDTFLRGVNLIHIPTTLLAQVDSSIGGKTGVNHKNGKNLIGSFKHPIAIFIDIIFLKTLSNKQFISGLAEVIKYGLIKDINFFNWLEQECENILDYDQLKLQTVITKSCHIKAEIIQDDEKENGKRALLNLGHTFAHAIEAFGNYDGKIIHGEAVSIGICLAFKFSSS